MVSIRRRRLLGLCSGQSSFLAPLPRFLDSGHTPENLTLNSRRFSVHPLCSIDFDQSKEKAIPKVHPGLSTASTSSSSKEQHHEQFADVPMSSKKNSRCTKKAGMKTTKHSTHKRYEVAVPEVKRRKRHRRKHFENQETCVMRGVYFKNMKWQAAIKVEKKQIHLGTVGSQEEAARLYDRAAFMCGREPNFELSEEEKQELRKFKWDEFLVVTRSAISNKKHQRRNGGLRRKVEPSQNSDWDADHGGFSGSED